MERGSSVEMASEMPVPDSEGVSCDLENVYENFKKGQVGEDDVDLDAYITAYHELYNFFLLLGSVFGFVASDVIQKLKILRKLKDESSSDDFQTVSKMMSFEMKEDLLKAKDYVSGSRTLLRLHRGLDFLRHFLDEVYKLDNKDNTGPVCRTAYDKTLAEYHPWVIRKGAQLAMKALPTKLNLLTKITGNDPVRAAKYVEVMPDLLKVMAEVYRRVNDLYTKNDLHGLK